MEVSNLSIYLSTLYIWIFGGWFCGKKNIKPSVTPEIFGQFCHISHLTR